MSIVTGLALIVGTGASSSLSETLGMLPRSEFLRIGAHSFEGNEGLPQKDSIGDSRISSTFPSGIGPGSSLIRDLDNSVNGQLFLDDTEGELFHSTCVALTLIETKFEKLDSLDGYGWSSRDRTIVLTTGPSIGNVDESQADQIYQVITGSGATLEQGSSLMRATNCDAERLRYLLPDLVLEIGAGWIVLEPDDYLLFDKESGICYILFDKGEYSDVFYFNPFAIPGLNVHIGKDRIFFCDADTAMPIADGATGRKVEFSTPQLPRPSIKTNGRNLSPVVLAEALYKMTYKVPAPKSSRNFSENSVPAYIDDKGVWSVDISVSTSHMPVRANLKLDLIDTFPKHGPPPMNRSVSVGLKGSENDAFTFETYGFWSEYPQFCGISIHWLGPLLRNAGSVSFVRSTRDSKSGRMIVESGLPGFISTCVEDSLIRLNLGRSSPDLSARITDQVTSVAHLDFRTPPKKDIEAYRTYVNTIYSTYKDRLGPIPDIEEYSTFVDTLGAIPTTLWRKIRRSLKDLGAIQGPHGKLSFNNCPETILDFLPQVEISGTYTGGLVLQPKQYMEFANGGRCTLLLGESGDGFVDMPDVRLDPFLLKNMNFRISNDGIWEFCEAKFEAKSAPVESALLDSPTVSVSAIDGSAIDGFGESVAGEGVSVSAGPGVSSTTTVVPSEEENTTLLA